MPRSERISPAIAKPLGLLNKPAKEKIKPKKPITPPTRNQEVKKPKSPSTNPAVPKPLEWLPIC